MTTDTYSPVDDDAAMWLIGEGVHTGLRKGSEAPSSATLWQAINQSDDSAWGDALRFCVEGLRSMGYVLCQENPPCTAVIWHGPGHHSKTTCEVRGAHTYHGAHLYGTHTGYFEWTEDEGFARP